MAIIDPIRVDGLRELQQSLRNLDGESQKKLRLVLNVAADLVVTRARTRTPKLTGRAARSIRRQSSQREARVKAGGAKVPYFGWLDYGGKIQRWPEGQPLVRQFKPEGRIIYPAFDDQRDEVFEVLNEGLQALVTEAGLDVDNG